MSPQDNSRGGDLVRASIPRQVPHVDGLCGGGFYNAVYTEPPAHLAAEFIDLRRAYNAIKSSPAWDVVAEMSKALKLRRLLDSIPQIELWRTEFENVWCLEGMEAVLTHALKGSAYTSTAFIGLIDSTGYGFAGANGTGVTKGALAGSITAVGGASPANGWNEAPSSVLATRGTPSFGTASSSGVNSDLASSSVALSILAARTIKGCFLVIKSKAGTASTSTVGNTAGAILSCGLFAEGDQVFSGAGTLNATYTARLTTT